jgi:Spy/CpxP family protein refolding chaperone
MQNDPLALYKRTGINQEQIDKINALTSEFQKLLTAKTQVLIGLMRDIRALSLQSDPDEKATLAKQGEINALNNEMADQRIKLMLNLRKVLSPEQRQKLVELMKQGQTVPAGTQAPPASSVPSEPGASGKAKQTTQQH